MTKEDFNPKILGFLCNWCCYAAADSAGVSRYQYPPNLRTIRVMCTGRIDPAFIMRGFVEGAAGIFSGGWQLGECHYQVGNYDAMGVNGLILKVLKEVGIDPRRYNLQWASAAEAPRFVKLITGFTNTVKELGPLGQSEGLKPEEAKERAEKALQLVSDRKLRMGFGNLSKELRKSVPGLTDNTIASAVDDKLTKTISSILG